MTLHFSLHATRTRAKECDLCGEAIPVRHPANRAEYWRIKGRYPNDSEGPRIICCLCHVMFGFPTDGWIAPPDGACYMSKLTPVENLH